MCKSNTRSRRYGGLYLLGVSEASSAGGINTEGELKQTSSRRVLPMGRPCTGGGRGISHRSIVQPIKKLVRTLSIFMSMAFVNYAKGISFKNILKGHINWRKVRNFNVI